MLTKTGVHCILTWWLLKQSVIPYGEIAQLARACGSYPQCRGFKSPSRYYLRTLKSLQGFQGSCSLPCHFAGVVEEESLKEIHVENEPESLIPFMKEYCIRRVNSDDKK